MLVTFKSNAPHADVTMFGSAATTLLRMMGLSGNVPGAIMAEEIPDALQKLDVALAARDGDDAGSDIDGAAGLAAPASGLSIGGLDAQDPGAGDPGGAPDRGAGGGTDIGSGNGSGEASEQKPIAIAQRAAPLIALFEAAQTAGASVLWNE